MKRTLAVMFAAIAISAPAVNHAHATFLCSNPHQTLAALFSSARTTVHYAAEMASCVPRAV